MKCKREKTKHLIDFPNGEYIYGIELFIGGKDGGKWLQGDEAINYLLNQSKPIKMSRIPKMKSKKKHQNKCGEITIGFNNLTTHEDIIQQVVDKLWLADFAPKEEIIEHLKIADILYKNNDFYAKKHTRGSK